LSAPSSSSSHALFDVELFRRERRRVAVVREVAHPTLVLGSTQPAELASPQALRERTVELVRRRGGGGAVYLVPGNHLWVDAWIPHDDVLWARDVSVAAEWVGPWWIEALGAAGGASGRLSFHSGRAEPGRLGELVCFAGRGPGEVFFDDRKVVGLSQWRSREGALFSSCAYLEWDPDPLLALLSVDEATGPELAAELRDVAVGVGALPPPVPALAEVRDRLTGAFPGIGAAAEA
jgi:lipoate-protein ligase A